MRFVRRWLVGHVRELWLNGRMGSIATTEHE